MNTFCKCRIHEDYRDPLDCHDYLTCTGFAKPLKQDCQHPYLIYDPYLRPAQCVSKGKFDCFNYTEKSGEDFSFHFMAF